MGENLGEGGKGFTKETEKQKNRNRKKSHLKKTHQQNSFLSFPPFPSSPLSLLLPLHTPRSTMAPVIVPASGGNNAAAYTGKVRYERKTRRTMFCLIDSFRSFVHRSPPSPSLSRLTRSLHLYLPSNPYSSRSTFSSSASLRLQEGSCSGECF